MAFNELSRKIDLNFIENIFNSILCRWSYVSESVMKSKIKLIILLKIKRAKMRLKKNLK